MVARALENRKWKLAPRASVLPTWERRGLPEELEGADSVIRCMPEDKTNGFFVACFERRGAGEERDVSVEGSGEAEGLEEPEPGKSARKAASTDRAPEASKRKAHAGMATSTKRPRDDGDDDDADDLTTSPTPTPTPQPSKKPKTQAQAERMRRKKKAQRAKANNNRG